MQRFSGGMFISVLSARARVHVLVQREKEVECPPEKGLLCLKGLK